MRKISLTRLLKRDREFWSLIDLFIPIVLAVGKQQHRSNTLMFEWPVSPRMYCWDICSVHVFSIHSSVLSLMDKLSDCILHLLSCNTLPLRMFTSSFSWLQASPHTLLDGMLILKCRSDDKKAFSGAPCLQDTSKLFRISWLPLKSPNSLSLNSEFQVYWTTDPAISCFHVNGLCTFCAHWNSLSQLLSLTVSAASKGISPHPHLPPFCCVFNVPCMHCQHRAITQYL